MLTPTETHVYVAVALHFTQYPTMLLLQRALRLREAFAELEAVPRYLVRAISSGIIMYVAGTGIVAALFPQELLTSKLGNAVCVLQSAVWLVRVFQQLCLVRPSWPKHARSLFWSVTSIYASLASLYTWFWWFACVA
jgi:hypothetical protein